MGMYTEEDGKSFRTAIVSVAVDSRGQDAYHIVLFTVLSALPWKTSAQTFCADGVVELKVYLIS